MTPAQLNDKQTLRSALPDKAPWIDLLETETLSIVDTLLEVRRYLHRHPEVSMQEWDTTNYLFNCLAELGLEPRKTTKGIGLTCDIASDLAEADCPIIGVRGDIDALPIQEQTTVEFSSRVAGVMHACGHDAHATMALGATLLIQRMVRNNAMPFPLRMRSLFQPAEETSQGGSAAHRRWLLGWSLYDIRSACRSVVESRARRDQSRCAHCGLLNISSGYSGACWS